MNLLLNSIAFINNNRLITISLILFIIAIILFFALDNNNGVNTIITSVFALSSYILVLYKIYFYKNKQEKIKNNFKEFNKNHQLLIDSTMKLQNKYIEVAKSNSGLEEINTYLQELIEQQRNSITKLENELYENKKELEDEKQFNNLKLEIYNI